MQAMTDGKRELLDSLENMLRSDGRAPKLSRWASRAIMTAGPYTNTAGDECYADVAAYDYDEQQRPVPVYLEVAFRGPLDRRHEYEEYQRITGLDADEAATEILSDMRDII
jgi:hypothetical protein